jgi:hypothetical protein
MSSTTTNKVHVAARTKVREYYVENKYLAGLVTTKHIVRQSMLEDEIVVSVPTGCKVRIVEHE